MIVSLKRAHRHFLRQLVAFLVLASFSLIAVVPSGLAQTQPTTSNPQGIQYIQTVPPEQQIDPSTTTTPNDQYTVPTPTGGETGRVLFSACDIDPTPTCNAVVGAVGDIGGKVFSAIFGGLGGLIKKGIVQFLKFIGEMLGFALDKYKAGCERIFQETADLITDSSDVPGATATKVADVQKFNAFVALDYGFSGLYDQATNARTGEYLALDIKENVLGIKDANAQGAGVENLSEGIRQVWAKIRDLSIILMVIALVIIGFMVMLRRRLDPKTVVTATNSLPRFAIALVLIIFSFALAGLFIDFIHLTVALVQNFFGGVFADWSQRAGGELIWFPFFAAFSLGTAINWSAVICSLPFGFQAVGVLVLILVVEIFIRLVLVIVGVYLFWVLLKNYAYMVLFTIFAPLMFLLGAIPGFESVTINWFKRMFVNSIAFPIILFLIYLALELISQTNFAGQATEGVVSSPPPLQTNILNIPYFIGLGMVFFATKVPQFLEKLFKLDSFDIKGGLGAGTLAAPIAVPMAGLKAAGNFGKTLSGVRDLANNTGIYGRAASNALFRGGYNRGMPRPVHDADGNVTHYEGQEAEAKQGFGASLSRAAGRMIPSKIAAENTKTAGTYKLSLEKRNAVIQKEVDDARKAGRAFNYGKVSREVGEVTPQDVQAATAQNVRVTEDISQIKATSPDPDTPKQEKENKDAADRADKGSGL